MRGARFCADDRFFLAPCSSAYNVMQSHVATTPLTLRSDSNAGPPSMASLTTRAQAEGMLSASQIAGALNTYTADAQWNQAGTHIIGTAQVMGNGGSGHLKRRWEDYVLIVLSAFAWMDGWRSWCVKVQVVMCNFTASFGGLFFASQKTASLWTIIMSVTLLCPSVKPLTASCSTGNQAPCPRKQCSSTHRCVHV